VSRALVVLRRPRGTRPPAGSEICAAIQADRLRLGLPAAEDVAYRLAGPYAVEVEGQPLDEYVAWEV